MLKKKIIKNHVILKNIYFTLFINIKEKELILL